MSDNAMGTSRGQLQTNLKIHCCANELRVCSSLCSHLDDIPSTVASETALGRADMGLIMLEALSNLKCSRLAGRTAAVNVSQLERKSLNLIGKSTR
jgi:hypothetical protein